MMRYITDRQARATRPGGKPIRAGVRGLLVYPSDTEPGCGKWILRFVSPVLNKRRDMGLGTFPDTGVARAVEKALEARALVQDGIDPIAARQSLRAVPTFEQAARDQWKILAPGFRNEKHRAQWISSLEQHLFPAIGHVSVDKLQAEHFADALRQIWLTVPETAKRVKMRASTVMAACRARKFIVANPLDDVVPLLPTSPQKDAQPARHHPAMPWQAVPEFIGQHLSKEPILGARAALLFAILTAARSGEVRGATWSEIDLEKRLWTIPAARMKAHREHRVPLAPAAIELLRQQLHGDTPVAEALVFPAPGKGDLSDMALTAILRRANAVSDTAGRLATAHGFRSSFRNWCADHGVNTELAERCLAHTIGNKVQASYERTDRLTARIKLMSSWADHVMGLPDEKVIPIKKVG